MPGALDVNAASFVERMIEPHGGCGVNHSGCFRQQALVGDWIEPTVSVADVSRKNLNPRPLRQRNECIGALLTRLPGPVADEQRQGGVRLPLQKFAHQLHSEEASCARN